jgi:hypothetical protein
MNVKYLQAADAVKAIQYATNIVDVAVFPAVTAETIRALFAMNPHLYVVFFNPRDYSDVFHWSQEDFIREGYTFEHDREKLEAGVMGYYATTIPFIQSRDVPYGEIIACGPEAYTLYRVKLERLPK